MAFAFGSFARGRETADSDLDIGVYLKDPRVEDELWSAISKIVKKEVDLVVLNSAPATLISNIVKTGIPMTIKDRSLYWDEYLTKSLEAEDFAEFVQSFWKIYVRSTSLMPEDRARLIERIQFLESELEEIAAFKTLGFEEYRNNKVKRRNVERWAENIINSTIDIGKIILASEKKRIPRTYEESLLEFAAVAGLTKNQAKRLAAFARLRNILAHEYLDILHSNIQNLIAAAPPLYKKIFAFLLKYTS
jgi:uncharacterized protein YutE (UPF0331/DUF86 family)